MAGRRRSFRTVEQDARAVALRRRHRTYQQIADELGFSSVSSAHEAVQRGLADIRGEVDEQERRLELERLDDEARAAWKVVETEHFAVTDAGRPVLHPVTGEPLHDSGPVLAALTSLRRIGESRRKLVGLDAPTKVQSEVRHVDAFDADIARLMADLASRGEGPPVGHPEVQPVASAGQTGPTAATG